MNEIVEMIYQWHQGQSILEISRSLGFDRKTVRRYVKLAETTGLKREDAFPDEQALLGRIRGLTLPEATYDCPAREAIAVHREQIVAWLEDPHMTAKQIWRLLREEHGLPVGYSSIKRYLKQEGLKGSPRVTIRMETPAGEEAQVDFGYAGMMHDPETGKKRKSWAFVLKLSYSRYPFVRFVFRQDVAMWIDCHERAFGFFGGVPERIVLDNLKAGVIKADIYDPTINLAYGELERHYGFVADPAKVRTPAHKGKVERSVPVVRGHLLAGRSFRDIREANERALVWCRQEIGMEVHGTTKRKPFEVFSQEEKPVLKPLPETPFEMAVWKEGTVHPDHHVVFDKSYYSVPTRYIGKKVWVRGDQREVRIFLNHELIKTHSRSFRPGTWVTDVTDYPPQKLAWLMSTPTFCRNKAAEYGPHVAQFVHDILSSHATRYLRKAQAILRLGEKYGSALDRACERALAFGNYRYKSLKAILEKGLVDHATSGENNPSAEPAALSPLGQSFLRPREYFRPEVHS